MLKYNYIRIICIGLFHFIFILCENKTVKNSITIPPIKTSTIIMNSSNTNSDSIRTSQLDRRDSSIDYSEPFLSTSSAEKEVISSSTQPPSSLSIVSNESQSINSSQLDRHISSEERFWNTKGSFLQYNPSPPLSKKRYDSFLNQKTGSFPSGSYGGKTYLNNYESPFDESSVSSYNFYPPDWESVVLY